MWEMYKNNSFQNANKCINSKNSSETWHFLKKYFQKLFLSKLETNLHKNSNEKAIEPLEKIGVLNISIATSLQKLLPQNF